MPTKGDAWIFLSYVVALFVGKEHVRGETTLGRIGVCSISSTGAMLTGTESAADLSSFCLLPHASPWTFGWWSSLSAS